MKRICLLALLPLLVIDCALNVLLGASWCNTLSSEAWMQRENPRFGWAHARIDAVFGAGHCHEQAVREAWYGSVWAAWWAGMRHG